MDEKEIIEINNLSLNIPDILDNADIFIWRFSNAPKELQALSVNGGDEDWLVLVKEYLYSRYYIPFLEDGMQGGIGGCNVDTFRTGEYLMLIGSHA